MRNSIRHLSLLIVAPLTLSNAFSIDALAVDRKEVIRQARQSYPSFQEEKVAEVRCTVKLDWDSMFKGLKVDAVGQEQLLPILRKTSFQILIGPDGASSISHQTDVAPPNENVAARVRQSTGGIEQVLTGFFQTWNLFMASSPFPDTAVEYELEDLPGKYDLTYKDGSTSVYTSMTHDLEIEEMKVTSATIDATLRPVFTHARKQYVLTGYEATYKAAAGESQHLSIEIENEDVEGLVLPQTVRTSLPTPAGTLDLVLRFAGYHIKKH